MKQLRQLYNSVKGTKKNKKEEEEPATSQEDRWLGPAQFLETTHTAEKRAERRFQKDERKQ